MHRMDSMSMRPQSAEKPATMVCTRKSENHPASCARAGIETIVGPHVPEVINARDIIYSTLYITKVQIYIYVMYVLYTYAYICNCIYNVMCYRL